MPLKPHPLAGSALAPTSPALIKAKEETKRAMSTVDDEAKSQYYGASLGFYKACLRGEFLVHIGYAALRSKLTSH